MAMPAAPALDVASVRAAFPILEREVLGRRLVYLDSAASAQRPRQVVEAMVRYTYELNANVHRGVHWLSQEATLAYDGVREQAARFLNARLPEEVVFAHGTTAAINLIATSYGGSTLRPGDEIVVTEMEHHSNFVPWQQLAARTGATFRVAPVDDDGSLPLDRLASLLNPRTRIVAVAHASNVLGTILPIAEIARMAHDVGAVLVVDGAQGAPHLPVDVQALGCDFYVLSGHKMYGPTGIGLLWGRHDLLTRMPPAETGGGMVARVTAERTTFAPPPARFEAGTPPITEVIGLGAAITFLTDLGFDAVRAHEDDLQAYATERLQSVPGLRIIGTAPHKVSVVSFVMDAAHPHDIGTVVDSYGVAIRAGHHCAQPLMDRFGVSATARASFGVYNTRDEVDILVAALDEVGRLFG